MGKFKNSVLISDFDGTLINKEGNISKENIDAINYYIDNGGIFCGATGRTHLGVDKMREALPVVAPWILFNGAGVYDFRSNEFVHVDSIDSSTLLPIAKEVMDKLPYMNVQVTTGKMQYFVNSNGRPDPIVIEENQLYEEKNIEEINEPWIKLIFNGSQKDLKKIEMIILERLDQETFRYFYSGKSYLEIMGRKVSKGTGLKALVESLTDNIEKIYAIGDYYNDVELLMGADISAAPDNAPDDIKENVDIIVSGHDNHAVMEFINWIDKNIYNNKEV
jgi:Cof subfamily protein (haloacid dehalogenase superfamily)